MFASGASGAMTKGQARWCASSWVGAQHKTLSCAISLGLQSHLLAGWIALLPILSPALLPVGTKGCPKEGSERGHPTWQPTPTCTMQRGHLLCKEGGCEWSQVNKCSKTKYSLWALFSVHGISVIRLQFHLTYSLFLLCFFFPPPFQSVQVQQEQEVLLFQKSSKTHFRHYHKFTMSNSLSSSWVAHVPVCLPPAVWTFYLHVRTESLQGWLLFPITKAIFQNFISLTAHLRSSYLLYLHTEKNDSDQGILNWRDITCSLPALTTSALLCHAFHVAMGDQEKPNAPAEVYLLQGLCFHQIKHTHCTNVIKAGSQTQVIKQQQQKTLKPFKPDSVKPEHKGEWPEGRCTYCEDIIVANLSLVVKRWRGSSRP